MRTGQSDELLTFEARREPQTWEGGPLRRDPTLNLRPWRHAGAGVVQAIADALVRGLRRYGGTLSLGTAVTSVRRGADGRACGVSLQPRGTGRAAGRAVTVRAKECVVSNATAWDTLRYVTIPAKLPNSC